MNYIAFVYFLSFLPILLIGSAPIEEFESFRLDLTDNEVEDELRRRSIGGPWEPEEAFMILNTALDEIANKTTNKARRFAAQAHSILELLTAQQNPILEEVEQDSDGSWSEADTFIEGKSISISTKRKIIDMIDGTNGQRRRSFEATKKLYPWLHPSYIRIFRDQLTDTRRSKLAMIDESVRRIFLDARKELKPVHGRMLQRWARQVAADLGLESFKASDGWLKNFKRRNGIVSRKVTNYVGRAESARAPAVAASIIEFKREYVDRGAAFEHAEVWNFDQTGFNYEPANLRTLASKGERDVELALDNKNKFTHSYTAQPMISRDGKLYPKLLLVMQEKDYIFGPKIAEKVAELQRQYKNIEVYASPSGKLTASLINRWFNTTLRSAIDSVRSRKHVEDGENFVLLLADSWSGHSSRNQIDTLKELGAETLRIPPLTTDRIQPLDVNYNRQYKKFYNRVAEEAFYCDLLPNITSREGILNVQSLIHNQFGSIAYRDMIKYAWRNTDDNFSAAELTHKPPHMVSEIQFSFDGAAKCSAESCEKHAFIKCSYCGQLLCLEHFLKRLCFHSSVRAKRSVETGFGVPDEEGLNINEAQQARTETEVPCPNGKPQAQTAEQDSTRLSPPDTSGDDEIKNEEKSVQAGGKSFSLAAVKNILELVSEGLNDAAIRTEHPQYRRQYLTTFQNFLRTSMTSADKMVEVAARVRKNYQKLKRKGLSVLGYKIKEWAIEAGKDVAIDLAASGARWFRNFLRNNRFTFARKKKPVEKELQPDRYTIVKIEDFKENLQYYIREFADSSTWNLDYGIISFNSSAGNYSEHSWIGIVSKDGQLIGNIALVLKEPTEGMSRATDQQHYDLAQEYGNILVYYSYDGRLNSDLMSAWVQEVLKPAVEYYKETAKRRREYHLTEPVHSLVRSHEEGIDDDDEACYASRMRKELCKCRQLGRGEDVCRISSALKIRQECTAPPQILMLCDAWQGYRAIIPEARYIGVKTIPLPERSGAIQPMDVLFKKQFEIFLNRIVSEALYQSYEEPTSPASLINIYSLIWNQLMSPLYADMIQLSWEKMENPKKNKLPAMVRKIQFKHERADCEVDGCLSSAFITCSHCGRRLCLNHFLERACFHPEPLPEASNITDSSLSDDPNNDEEEQEVVLAGKSNE